MAESTDRPPAEAASTAKADRASTAAIAGWLYEAAALAVAAGLVAGLVVWIRHGPAPVVRPPIVPGAAAPAPGTTSPGPASAGPTTTIAATAPAVPSTSMPYHLLPAGKGLAWADAVQADKDRLILTPGPVGDYQLGDYHSATANISGGVRATLAPEPCGCRPVQVWFAGGSAAFGTGQRDDHTIASDLVRITGAEGLHVQITNLGVPGYTLWQEYQAVLARLAGPNRPRPDVVAFYDGFNDMVVSFAEAVGGNIDFAEPAVFDVTTPFELVSAAVSTKVLVPLGGPAGVGRTAARRYVRLRDIVASELAADGIATAFYLQPDALATANQRTAALTGDKTFTPAQIDLFAAMLDAGDPLLAEGPRDLRHIYAGRPTPVFWDLIHTNDAGALVVAGAIARDLTPELRRAAGG